MSACRCASPGLRPRRFALYGDGLCLVLSQIDHGGGVGLKKPVALKFFSNDQGSLCTRFSKFFFSPCTQSHLFFVSQTNRDSCHIHLSYYFPNHTNKKTMWVSHIVFRHSSLFFSSNCVANLLGCYR